MYVYQDFIQSWSQIKKDYRVNNIYFLMILIQEKWAKVVVHFRCFGFHAVKVLSWNHRLKPNFWVSTSKST